MKMFLQLAEENNRFEIFSDIAEASDRCTITFRYIGYIELYENNWTCYPEKRIQDIDPKIISDVDLILQLLNSNS